MDWEGMRAAKRFEAQRGGEPGGWIVTVRARRVSSRLGEEAGGQWLTCWRRHGEGREEEGGAGEEHWKSAEREAVAYRSDNTQDMNVNE